MIEKFRFGKYKGKLLKDVPEDYLIWGIKNNVFRGKLMASAKRKVKYPKDKYVVIVEDAVDGDGKYETEAYTQNEAINNVIRKNPIQISQSFSGTTFCAIKIEPNKNEKI